MASGFLQKDTPIQKSEKKSASYGRVAFAIAAAGLATTAVENFAFKESLSPVDVPILTDSDKCLYRGAQKLMSQFNDIDARDKEWQNITLSCAQDYGLPDEVAINIDNSRIGQARYVRLLSPTGD